MTLHRLSLVLPALLLGCGAAPSPAAPASPDAPAASPSSQAASAQPAPDAAAVPPSPAAKPAAAGAAPPAGDAQPAAATADAPLATAITQKEVLDQVQKHADLFDRCVSIGATASRAFRAKVTIKATIGPSGTVNAADVASSTAKNAAVDACVLDAFKKLTFPRPKGSGVTILMCPLSFDAAQVAQ